MCDLKNILILLLCLGAGCAGETQTIPDLAGPVVEADAPVGVPPVALERLAIPRTEASPVRVPPPRPESILPRRDDAYEDEAMEGRPAEESAGGSRRSEGALGTDRSGERGGHPETQPATQPGHHDHGALMRSREGGAQ